MMQFCTSTVVCWTIVSEKIDLPLELLGIQHSCQLPETPQDICIQSINDYYSSVMSFYMYEYIPKQTCSILTRAVCDTWVE